MHELGNGLRAEAAYEIAGTGPLCIGMAGGPGFSSGYLHDGTLERHLTMIYLDLLGTGASQKLPESEEYSMERDVATIDAVRAAVGVSRVCVLGHSYGGMVAMQFAIDHPRETAAVILYSTTPTMTADWEVEIDENRKWFAKEPWYAAARKGRALQGRATNQDESELAFWLEVPFYFADWTHHAAEYTAVVKKSVFTFEVFRRRAWTRAPRFDVRDKLGAIAAPALVVGGDRDFMCGTKPSRYMARAIRGARLVMVPGVGHFAHVEAPELFERAIAAFVGELAAH